MRSTWGRLSAAILSVVSISVGAGTAQGAPDEYFIYFGTYTHTASKGIYAYRFQPANGSLTPLGLAAETPHPSFVVAHPNGRFLYAANEHEDGNPPGTRNSISAFEIDTATGRLTFLNKASAMGTGPCHVSVDRTGTLLLVANYESGSVAVLPIGRDGRLSEATSVIQHKGSSVDPVRQLSPHAHFVAASPDNRFALVVDLGMDRVMAYRLDAGNGTLSPEDPSSAPAQAGSGPRHLSFHPSGRYAYVNGEMSSTVTVFAYDARTAALKPLQTVSTLPSGFTGTSATAEIQTDPSGRFLYVSNRGLDSIAVFAIDGTSGLLTPVQQAPTGGSTPRYFAFDPTGAYVFAGNQNSNTVTVYRTDAQSGRLTPVQTLADVPEPASFAFAAAHQAPARYDLLLRGGHVIDPRNGIDGRRDVAVAAGRIAAVAPAIDPVSAKQTIDAADLYIVPGLVDIHTHVYAGTGERNSYAGDLSVYPDTFALRSGVTTVVDAGGAGWRNFEDFKQRIIDRSTTRVLAFLNIVGQGMRGGKFEQDLADMAVQPAADMARRHPGLIVGIKTAHFSGPEWTPIEHAVEAGTLAGVRVMVDFGANRPERPLGELMATKLRAGDIYTHVYSGLRGELDSTGRLNSALAAGRTRGVLFDVGHGARSFAWRVAQPATKEQFLPDTISTDLHLESMNGAMKDLLGVMTKFLALGLTLDQVVQRATWNAARTIGQDGLGHLSVGVAADIAVLRVERGRVGLPDAYGTRVNGMAKLVNELTIRGGRIVYDLNGLAVVP